jgi:hypothetical protein
VCADLGSGEERLHWNGADDISEIFPHFYLYAALRQNSAAAIQPGVVGMMTSMIFLLGITSELTSWKQHLLPAKVKSLSH